MELSKISSKGQLVIPVSIRQKLDIRPGTVFEVRPQGDHIVLTPRKGSPLDRLYGKFRDDSVLESLEAEHADELAKERRS